MLEEREGDGARLLLLEEKIKKGYGKEKQGSSVPPTGQEEAGQCSSFPGLPTSLLPFLARCSPSCAYCPTQHLSSKTFSCLKQKNL